MIMKAVRFLLIVIVILMSSVSVLAQFNQPADTEYHFRSTSSFSGSGSHLPIAAQSGVVMVSSLAEDDSPIGITQSGPRKAKKGGDPFGGETIDDVDNPQQPGTPIGNGICVLLMMAAGYAEYRRRKLQNVTD